MFQDDIFIVVNQGSADPISALSTSNPIFVALTHTVSSKRWQIDLLPEATISS